ncbi:MAG: type II secretion system protein [Deltaproteobacteria bacterium]|jgi:prepilin-type N-terminal cleavage/methylation domain-containing protein|nr:type II secretion system protein [Deltaproteobacteria bacterium]
MASRRQGFTLVELMVVTVLMGVLVLGVTRSFTDQKKSANVNDQIAEIQHGTRLIGALLEEDIRHAGFMVPEPAAVCLVDQANAPDSLFVSDASVIEPIDEIRNDLGARIGGGLTNVANGAQTLDLDTLLLEFTTPDAAYDTDGDGTADSDFRVNGGVIVADAGNPSRGTACGVVTGVTLAGPEIAVTIVSGALGALPATPDPVDLVAVPAHVYQVTAGMQLTRDGMLVADDVEDLQIAVFVDADVDREVDAGEYRGDGVGADFDPTAVDATTIREIRANVALRTRREDLDNPNGRFQQSENRGAVGAADGYRRRVHSSIIKLRNVGSRAETT